jgi:NADH-quinone oxidoreductase subunit D
MANAFHDKNELRVISMGPQHPSMHGVLRLEVTLDGEIVVDVKPDIGFLHRGIEKMAEARTYTQFVPYPDRLDYVSAYSNNLAYCHAIEKLAGITVPPRAQWQRTLFLELQRIASHLVWLGTYALDLGATTPFLYTFREREDILDLFERATGARMTYSWCRIGGLPQDFPDGFDEACRKFLKLMPGRIVEYDNLFSGNRIVRARLEGVGMLPAELALSYGCSGPTLRGSGVNYDVRKADPFAVYPEMDFEVPLSDRCDCYGRYLIRIEEMRQSLRIIEQVLDKMPEGELMAKGVKSVKPPAGETFAHIEAPRGDFGVFVASDGKDKPVRLRFRAPSFSNLSAIADMTRGHKLADVVAVLGSIDIVLGEIDR